MKCSVITLFMFFATVFCYAQPVEDREKLVDITAGIAQKLSAGEFEQVRETFDTNMKNALSAQQLQQVWDGLVAQIGAYQELGSVTSKKIQGYNTIYQILKFEKSPFKLKAVFNDAQEVVGLFLIPVNAQ